MITFSTVPAACRKNEIIIKKLQNMPPSFNEFSAPAPLK